MKKLQGLITTAAVALLLVTAGCKGGYNGQLLGEQDRPSWNPITPYGMVFVPSGVLHIGPSDQDVNASYQARAKQVSIVGFYMDDTEITNNEYRQFINWVRDSVAHKTLGHTEGGGEGEGDGIGEAEGEGLIVKMTLLPSLTLEGVLLLLRTKMILRLPLSGLLALLTGPAGIL